MHPIFKAYWSNLEELHQQIRGCLEDLPPAALDWTPPGPGFNSPSVLVVHLAGAEKYWLGDVVAGEPSNRDREAEFKVRQIGPEQLKDRLADIERDAHRILETLTPQDLETVCISPRDGREFTVAWALAHLLMHTALHLGHLQMTRQLWDLEGKS